MFRTAQDLLLIQDGVSAQLVGAGPARRQRADDRGARRAAVVTERRSSAPLLRRLRKPALG